MSLGSLFWFPTFNLMEHFGAKEPDAYIRLVEAKNGAKREQILNLKASNGHKQDSK